MKPKHNLGYDKRGLVTSEANTVAAMQNAKAVVEYVPKPPKRAKLDANERYTWDEIIEMYRGEPDFWRPGDEFLLLMYVRCLVRWERLIADIDVEGYTSESTRGTPVINPKVNAANSIGATISNLSARLRMTPQARVLAPSARQPTPSEVEVKQRASEAAGVMDESDGLLVGRQMDGKTIN